MGVGMEADPLAGGARDKAGRRDRAFRSHRCHERPARGIPGSATCIRDYKKKMECNARSIRYLQLARPALHNAYTKLSSINLTIMSSLKIEN